MRISDWSSDVCSSDLDLALSVNRVDGALRLKKIPIAVDDTPLRIRGTVGSSLYRSARAAGAPAKAVQAYLKALATKLSLDRDVSANDKFDIILGYRRAETGEVEVGDLLFAGLEGSEERRVGKECVSTCRSRVSRNH